ncbi:Ig-like domain-containing protein [Providencia rettgeri]|nr:Ig-like domain-containing protein [Providencia rettgeri]ELR5204617.1 Ig-like domain-containing protein [Providencia rettgeri]MBQ0364944.1 Ig-like domain-containing protein [Providencia rettgeri]HEM7189098.1 Ig-like domain-containing protein [Providencia rettgeri]
MSADKTSAIADSADVVTVTLNYTKGSSPVEGATVNWSTTGGNLSVTSSKTGKAGGATVKLTSDTDGKFIVTATADGVTQSTDEITFTAKPPESGE